MKKVYIVFVLLLSWGFLLKAQTLRPLNWYELSFDRDSVYGIELDKAYEFLKGKTKKQKVVVAVIDGGFDDQHEDLKNVLWTNPGEIPGNRIDDDKNGYVDDAHGWNFLVTKDGKPVLHTMKDADRLFLRKKDRYDQLSVKVRNAKEEEEYQKLRTLFQKSDLGMKYLAVEMTKVMKQYVEGFDRAMRAEFPGDSLTKEHFNAILKVRGETDTLKMTTHMFYNMMWEMQPGVSWENMFAGRLKSIEMAEQDYEQILRRRQDDRSLIGDDMANLKDRNYGSPVLISENSEHGTHVAGIIGAERENQIGMDGVANHVALMLLGAVPQGDENDKDIALAIRYAVDNGAKVINMSFGKAVSLHPEWVTDAMRYAEKKGVLLVRGAGNSFTDIDKVPFYPTKHISSKKMLGNLLTVGASDPEGNPALQSNYGLKEVDLFAPGVDIYSTIAGDNYKKMGGTSMASPVVAGVAALLMTYYPELTVSQIRDVLIRTAVTRKGAMVQKPRDPMLLVTGEEVPFSELCVSGGIIDAWEAVKLAEEMVIRKSK